MEAGAEDISYYSDRSLESQSAGDLIPYEYLVEKQLEHAIEVLPGWYTRGAPMQVNGSAQ